MEIDHEIISTVIYPLQLIQEGDLSSTDIGKNMCVHTDYITTWITISLPRKILSR